MHYSSEIVDMTINLSSPQSFGIAFQRFMLSYLSRYFVIYYFNMFAPTLSSKTFAMLSFENGSHEP